MQLTRRSFGLAALSGVLAAPALARAPFAGAQAPGVYRLKVGAFEITVLNDGWLPLEAKVFSGDPTTAPRLLDAGFLPKDAIPTSVNEWLVNTGDKLVLVDTGTSDLFGPTLGRLARNLGAAGVDPDAVDAIVLTHMHPDHANGLLTPDKKVVPKCERARARDGTRLLDVGPAGRRMISSRSSKWLAMPSNPIRMPAR
jgi:glyoxylase-like metal-dependent hydrolase (beta-lactamase superfamily II)